MRVPPITHPCWMRLASGAYARMQTKQLGLQFLFKRISDPKLSIPDRVRELHGFFAKYHAILGDEIGQLERI